MVVPNLNAVADVSQPGDAVDLRGAARDAEVFAFDLSSLLDGQEGDALAEILVPVRDFLKKLAGIS